MVISFSEVVSKYEFDCSPAEEFGDFINYARLLELNHKGNPSSWCNNQKGVERIYKKLDRLLGNASWLNLNGGEVSYLT